jgi:hypothetical protein
VGKWRRLPYGASVEHLIVGNNRRVVHGICDSVAVRRVRLKVPAYAGEGVDQKDIYKPSLTVYR